MESNTTGTQIHVSNLHRCGVLIEPDPHGQLISVLDAKRDSGPLAALRGVVGIPCLHAQALPKHILADDSVPAAQALLLQALQPFNGVKLWRPADIRLAGDYASRRHSGLNRGC